MPSAKKTLALAGDGGGLQPGGDGASGPLPGSSHLCDQKALMLSFRNRVTLSDFVPRPTFPTSHFASLAVPTLRPSRKIVTARFRTTSLAICHCLLVTV